MVYKKAKLTTNMNIVAQDIYFILLMQLIILVPVFLIVGYDYWHAKTCWQPIYNITYGFHPSISGSDKAELLILADQAGIMWSNANPGIKFTHVNDPNVLIKLIENFEVDGRAYCHINGHKYTIVVNANTTDRFFVLAHEFGHVLGVQHNKKPGNLMYGEIGMQFVNLPEPDIPTRHDLPTPELRERYKIPILP